MKQILLFITAILIATSVMAQNQQDAAAQQGLQNFKRLLTAQSSKANDSLVRDLDNLSLGTPVPTAIITLENLRKFTPDQAARNLVTDADKYIYPVINRRTQRVASTVTVEKVKDKWTASALGADKRIAEKIGQYTSGLADFKLIRILAFNLSFIGVNKEGTLQLTPLQDDPERNIFQGRPIAAERVLETYVKAANEYNGLPL